jgi:predicted Zn-ribbon and HTH transcriptional regulator
MDKENEKLFNEEEVNEPIRCVMCGWEGFEAELEEGYYDSYNMSMPVACHCPQCGSDNLE